MRGPAPPLHMMRGARRAVLGHRVHPSARDGIERIWRDGSFWHGCQRRKPRSERVQEEQCSFVGIGGRLVNVPVKTSMTTMLVNATLPSREVCGHLSGALLDPLLVHEGREKERENL